MDYIQKINHLIKIKKITQIEFSEGIGVTKTTINNYLKRRTKIDVDILIRIAEFLQVPVSHFFDESGGVGNGNIQIGNKSNQNIGGAQTVGDCEPYIKEISYLKQLLKAKDETIEALKSK